MTIKLGVIMDPIGSINYKKDSTLAMLLAASARGWQLFCMQQSDLYINNSTASAMMQPLEVKAEPQGWFTLDEAVDLPLNHLDVILMRKDPPFDMDYIYTTYILELAELEGTLVVNKPQSLRDANEKLFTTHFPQCCPETLISSQQIHLRKFLTQQKDIIVKPLEGMGGASIFRISEDDPNVGVILETMTQHGRRQIMAQRYIAEITEGDKRILLIDGKPVPYALARKAAKGETRANLAVGGYGEGVSLTERDYWICEQLAPTLKQKGLIFVGLDVIGDYLTEVNVTSPTCIRELDDQFGLNIGDQLMSCIAGKLNKPK